MSRTYKVTIQVQPRDDGGLRVWSDDVPELALSHSNPALLMEDVPRALEVILGYKLGCAVQVRELVTLPDRPLSDDFGPRDYAAIAA